MLLKREEDAFAVPVLPRCCCCDSYSSSLPLRSPLLAPFAAFFLRCL